MMMYFKLLVNNSLMTFYCVDILLMIFMTFSYIYFLPKIYY